MPETPERIYARAETAVVVHRAMAQLSETHGEALRLCDLEGESYATIAAVTECPLGTVMSRLFHARRKLARELTQIADRRRRSGGPARRLTGRGRPGLWPSLAGATSPSDPGLGGRPGLLVSHRPCCRRRCRQADLVRSRMGFGARLLAWRKAHPRLTIAGGVVLGVDAALRAGGRRAGGPPDRRPRVGAAGPAADDRAAAAAASAPSCWRMSRSRARPGSRRC